MKYRVKKEGRKKKRAATADVTCQIRIRLKFHGKTTK